MLANAAVFRRGVLNNLSSDTRGMMVKLPTIPQRLINSKASLLGETHVKGFSVTITESEIYLKSYQGSFKHHMLASKKQLKARGACNIITLSKQNAFGTVKVKLKVG